MRIPELYARSRPAVSFELFPPKSDEAEENLFLETLPALKTLNPGFVSVTYGAGGGTRTRTLRMVDRVRRQFGIEAMTHLTCVGSTEEMLGGVLDEAHSLGISNVLALRGDPPKGEKEFKPVPGGFRHAVELVRFVKSRGCFAVGAACYPEGHVECCDRVRDWDHAAHKVENGAEFLITQLFYDVNAYFEMVDYLRNRRGVSVPIIPGILPFLGSEQIKRFTTLCGAKLPEPLRLRLEELAGDDESVRKLGVEVCTQMCRQLLDSGVPGLHLYCLNRVTSVSEMLHNLGLVPGSMDLSFRTS